MSSVDAVIVGSGPNGLAAAITIAQAGRKVVVFEAAPTVGGGCRSTELTLPGFVHDVCSAVHPLAVASPFFRTLPLEGRGLAWVEPPAMFAHPLDEGPPAMSYRSIRRTADSLGADAAAYEKIFGRLAERWPLVEADALAPLGWPKHPLEMARLGWQSLRGAAQFARSTFKSARARAFFAGLAGHSMVPLTMRPAAGIGLVLGVTAHLGGWLFPRGGAQQIANALAAHLRSLGGEIVLAGPVQSVDDLPPARAILCDLSPRPLLRIAGHRFPASYRRALERYRYGMGTYKVDWALDGPIPWRHPECAAAGVVHIGGTLEEICAAEQDAWAGEAPQRPFVLLAQPSLFDASRAPAGRHVVWAYCHVPHGSVADMLPRIEAQIERFAPGFRDRVLARAIMQPADFERYNPNLVGGDIGSGVTDLRQLFTRPTWRTYGTPVRGLYICSAATPPGVGVHGMCGYFAARRALNEVLRD